MEEVASPVINSGISAKVHHKHYVLPPLLPKVQNYLYTWPMIVTITVSRDECSHEQQHKENQDKEDKAVKVANGYRV